MNRERHFFVRVCLLSHVDFDLNPEDSVVASGGRSSLWRGVEKYINESIMMLCSKSRKRGRARSIIIKTPDKQTCMFL